MDSRLVAALIPLLALLSIGLLATGPAFRALHPPGTVLANTIAGRDCHSLVAGGARADCGPARPDRLTTPPSTSAFDRALRAPWKIALKRFNISCGITANLVLLAPCQ